MSIHIPSVIQWVIQFIDTHLIYWVMLVALIFEFRYLLHKDRREQIAMSRWGQPLVMSSLGSFIFFGCYMSLSHRFLFCCF